MNSALDENDSIFSRRQQPAFAQGTQQGNERHPKDGKMVAVDPVEELHPARLQPKHADSVADLGPFGIEIVRDEPF